MKQFEINEADRGITFIDQSMLDIAYENDNKSGKPQMRLKNVLLDEFDVPTSNNTYYSTELMDPFLEKFKVQIEKGMGYLYVDHPMPNADNVARLPNQPNTFRRVGARVTSLKKTDNKVYADMIIAQTSGGKDLAACLETGGSVGFSKRGILSGWQEQNISGFGKQRVPLDYHFEGWDIVIGQSVENAMTKEYVFENNQNINNNNSEDIMPDFQINGWNDLKKLPAEVFNAIEKQAFEQFLTSDVVKKKIAEGIKLETDKLDKTVQESLSKKENELSTLSVAIEKVVKAIIESGLVDTREPSVVESDLKAKLDAKEQEVSTLNKKIEDLQKSATESNKVDTKEKMDKIVQESYSEIAFKDAIMKSFVGKSFETPQQFKDAFEQANDILKSVNFDGKGIGVAENEDETQENRQQTANEQNTNTDKTIEDRKKELQRKAGIVK